MKEEAYVIITAQKPFNLINRRSLHLRFSPALYVQLGSTEPYGYDLREETRVASGGFSNGVRVNAYGQRYPYASDTLDLVFRSSSTEYKFHALKLEGKVIYSAVRGQTAVRAGYFIFNDFLHSVRLLVEDLRPDADHEDWLEAEVNEQIVKFSSAGALRPAPREKVSQITIPDTQEFSFLSNVNIHFSGCDVYKVNGSGQVIKVDRHGHGSGSVLASGYYLTPGKGYPSGRTTLTIRDGFEEASAVVEFDHDVARKQVVITIKSFTSSLCDIRDASSIIPAPNAICFAL